MRPDSQPTRQDAVRLADYRPPAWLVEHVRLDFDLSATAARVRARVAFRLNPEHDARAGLPELRLDGRRLTLVSAAVDGTALQDDPRLTVDREGLTVAAEALPGPAFAWDCTTEIDPEANTELEGLYLSNG
ncbi:MAG: aminopeptidase N, partial [Pseudomonadota bacterium]